MTLDLDLIGAGLPVAEHRDELADALSGRAVVVQAPPGTGKTTYVPALTAVVLGQAGGRPGRVVVTQPRRMAARAAARRLSALTGTRLGQLAGHTVRGESSCGPGTGIEFVTTGVLLRRLLADPGLPGIDAVILDEVHERHLDSDLVAAMVSEVAQLRDDLTVVAMSATLDAARWGEMLEAGTGLAVRVVEVPAVLHPLDVRWAPFAGSPLDERGVRPAFLDHVATCTRQALAASDGSVLVFVPGVREVEQVVSRLGGPRADGVEVLGLSGRTDPRDQDEVLTPSPARRVVVATSVAESSLTVPGVRAVVDSGLAREPRLDRGRGMTGLVTVRESRASATQRAGRAARLGPGLALRCLRAEDWAGMDAEPAPEVEHADLVGPVLTLACWGSPRGEGMALPDPLPADRVAVAQEELIALGALDEAGRATDRGRRLARVPADPRLARALVDGVPLVGQRAAAEVVAMLAGEDRAVGADLVGLLRALRRGTASTPRWRAEADRLSRLVGGSTSSRRRGVSDEEAVGTVVALARPQSVARRRDEGSTSYLMASGTAADLPVGSQLAGQEWLAVAESSRTSAGRGSGALIRAAVPVDAALAMTAAAALDRTEVVTAWHDGRVRARRVHRLGAIELSSTPVRPAARDARDAVLAALGQIGPGLDGHGVLTWSRAALDLRRRLGLVRREFGDPWPDMSEEALVARAEEWIDLDAVAQGRPFNPAASLRALVPWPQAGRLDDLVPEAITVPTGSRIRLDYPEVGSDGAPVLAVKLQECFGWTDTPTICEGRVRVVLHLLSPARRPLAVTDNLASFWVGVYPQVRAENRGRYSKHPWPQDPLTAPAMRGTTRSGR